MRALFLILFFSFTLTSFAQEAYTKIQWKATPALHTIEKKYSDAAAVYVLDKKVAEFSIEKDGFFVYRTVHRIAHINNDKGIESFNKVYLPSGEGVQLLDVRARTILPGGKVMELDKNNIKDIQDEGNSYKIFALDGLTKGCEVEYYFTIKKEASYFGTDILSYKIPTMQSHWELSAPATLVFETKSFNDLPGVKDSSSAEKRYLWLDAQNIDEAADEKYAMYDANLKRIEYKLAYNKAKNENVRLFTWNELAKKAYALYADIDDKSMKKLKDVAGDMGILKSSTPVEKITAIENYIKANFMVRKDVPSEDADDIAKVLKTKIISERADIKLFLALLNIADVPHQLVFCGDRSDYTLDRTFENWNNASNNLIYFPDQKKFLAPTEMEFRYPWIPPNWAGALGLFCVPTTIGNFTTAVSEMKMIPFEAYEHTFSNLNVKASIEGDDAVLQVQQLYGGYSAANYRAPFVFAPADEQEKFLKELVKFGTNSENITAHSFENKELEQTDPYKPFIINATVKSAQLFDKAGDKYLVKVGELIGPQSEMYDTKERTAPIVLYYPHSLVRHIELTIPDGYNMANPDDLNSNVVYKDGDVVTMGFASSYELNGNNLKITVQEDYRNVAYPVAQYDSFKKVINASADFNKVVLILAKK